MLFQKKRRSILPATHVNGQPPLARMITSEDPGKNPGIESLDPTNTGIFSDAGLLLVGRGRRRPTASQHLVNVPYPVVVYMLK